jgi:phosphate transport system substrate-binding protein
MSADCRIVTSLLILVSLATGCRSERLETVRVSGASAVYPIVQMAGEELRRERRLNVQAQAGGSTRGFMDTIAGRNDLGAMARDLTPDETAQVKSWPIALDGVGILVHKSNSISNLATSDLQRIYRKAATDWADFGADKADIVVVTKAEGHATLQVFLDHTHLARDEVKADVVAGNNAQVIQAVANSKHAIGYVSLGEAIHAADAGMAVRLIALDGVAPAVSAVADGRWPICRKLYLISKDEPRGGSLALLDYLRSEKGSAIILRGGYVPLH